MISGVRASSIHHHVVAQIVEAELVVGAVENVGPVRLGALDRSPVVEAIVAVRRGILEGGIVDAAELVADHTDADPERVVDRPHPTAAEAREIVVGGDEVDALAGERVEVERQGGDERLPFAGPHLGDPAGVEDDTARQLDVEVPLPIGALARLADGGECLRQEVIEGFPLREPLLERERLRGELIVVELRELWLQIVDLRDLAADLFKGPARRIAEDLGEELTHESDSLSEPLARPDVPLRCGARAGGRGAWVG